MSAKTPEGTASRSRKALPKRQLAGLPKRQFAGAEVSESRLKNGLRVIVAERHSDPVVAVMVFYAVGALNESEREAGVSHFLEHMMFKGTHKFGKGSVDHLTTVLGGQNNAFTGYDHTAYWYEFASDRWEQALELEADRMQHLELDPAEFAAERDVVLEELAMGEDDPWRVLARRVEARVWESHPYGRPIIGYPETLRGMSPEDMRDYYRRFYQPGNATLVVVGDVKPAAVLKAARQQFGAIPKGPEPVSGFRLEPEEPFGEQRLEMRWPDPGQRLCIAWRGAQAGSTDDYALDLVVTALTGGRNSRLQRRLVVDGELCAYISTSNDARVAGGLFWLMAEASLSVKPEAVLAVIDEELRRMATEPLTRAELTRARKMLLASEAHDAETVTDLAEEIGGWAVDADWSHAFDGGERHGAISARELRDATARLLSDERRVVGWCLPAEGQK